MASSAEGLGFVRALKEGLFAALITATVCTAAMLYLLVSGALPVPAWGGLTILAVIANAAVVYYYLRHLNERTHVIIFGSLVLSPLFLLLSLTFGTLRIGEVVEIVGMDVMLKSAGAEMAFGLMVSLVVGIRPWAQQQTQKRPYLVWSILGLIALALFALAFFISSR